MDFRHHNGLNSTPSLLLKRRAVCSLVEPRDKEPMLLFVCILFVYVIGSLPKPFTEAEITAFLELFNAERKEYPAASLPNLVWDPDAVTVVQAYTNRCIPQSNQNSSQEYQAITGKMGFLSELSHHTMNNSQGPLAALSWSAQKGSWDCVSNGCRESGNCSQYAQLIWNQTLSVGCGRSNCFENSPFPAVPNWTTIACDFYPGSRYPLGERPFPESFCPTPTRTPTPDPTPTLPPTPIPGPTPTPSFTPTLTPTTPTPTLTPTPTPTPTPSVVVIPNSTLAINSNTTLGPTDLGGTLQVSNSTVTIQGNLSVYSGGSLQLSNSNITVNGCANLDGILQLDTRPTSEIQVISYECLNSSFNEVLFNGSIDPDCKIRYGVSAIFLLCEESSSGSETNWGLIFGLVGAFLFIVVLIIAIILVTQRDDEQKEKKTLCTRMDQHNDAVKRSGSLRSTKLRHDLQLANSGGSRSIRNILEDPPGDPVEEKMQSSIRRISDVLLARGESNIRKLFRKLDTRFYGYITSEQFRSMLDDRDLGKLGLSPYEKDLITSYVDDTDEKDGKIDYHEFFTIFYQHLADAAKENKTTLRQIFIITRHGARFPLTPFPNNTAWPNAKSFWSTYGGKLAPKGISQHLRLGRMIRETYFGPLGLHADDHRLPEKLHVYTSNTDRTFLSASSLLQGMCPKIAQSYVVEHEEDQSDRHYQGIKIHIADTDRKSTPVVHGYLDNPNYNIAKAKSLEDCDYFREISTKPEYLEFLEKMWKMTGHKNINPDQDIVSRFKKFSPLASQMEIERTLKMPLYANKEGLLLSEEDEEKAIKLSEISKRIKFTGNNDEEHRNLARSAAGLLPSTVVNFLNLRITKPADEKKKSIVFFSAHDYTIMAFLSQMGFREWEIPKFAAILIFELHKTSKTDYHIEIKYNPDTSKNKSLQNLRTYKMPKGLDHVDMEKAEEGQHTWEEFRKHLMETRKSFKNEEEWRENAGPSKGLDKEDIEKGSPSQS